MVARCAVGQILLAEQVGLFAVSLGLSNAAGSDEVAPAMRRAIICKLQQVHQDRRRAAEHCRGDEGRWDVADGGKQVTVVTPTQTFQGFPLGLAHRFAGTDLGVDLGFEQANHTFGKCVVAGVTNGSDREIDFGFGQTLGVFDRQVLRSTIKVMDQALVVWRLSLSDSVFQRVEGELGLPDPNTKAVRRTPQFTCNRCQRCSFV